MDPHYDPAGSALLKITGILMIVFGALGILLYLAALAAFFGMRYMIAGIFSTNLDLIGAAVLLAGSLMELIAGILGAKHAKHPERAVRCITAGCLSLLLTLAGLAYLLLRSKEIPWAATILGILTPVIYLIGAIRLRRSPSAPEEQTEPGDAPLPRPMDR